MCLKQSLPSDIAGFKNTENEGTIKYGSQRSLATGVYPHTRYQMEGMSKKKSKKIVVTKGSRLKQSLTSADVQTLMGPNRHYCLYTQDHYYYFNRLWDCPKGGSSNCGPGSGVHCVPRVRVDRECN